MARRGALSGGRTGRTPPRKPRDLVGVGRDGSQHADNHRGHAPAEALRVPYMTRAAQEGPQPGKRGHVGEEGSPSQAISDPPLTKARVRIARRAADPRPGGWAGSRSPAHEGQRLGIMYSTAEIGKSRKPRGTPADFGGNHQEAESIRRSRAGPSLYEYDTLDWAGRPQWRAARWSGCTQV
jgi:hypothetical protein